MSGRGGAGARACSVRILGAMCAASRMRWMSVRPSARSLACPGVRTSKASTRIELSSYRTRTWKRLWISRATSREGRRLSLSLKELLVALEIRRFTDVSRDRIAEALEQAKLVADRSLHDVERDDHLLRGPGGTSTVDGLSPPFAVSLKASLSILARRVDAHSSSDFAPEDVFALAE